MGENIVRRLAGVKKNRMLGVLCAA